MRVIGGTARGKRLAAPKGWEVRPTTDRVKEGLFNSIQFEISGACFLDLFSGSGQMGIEALSRGACTAVLIDHSAAAQQVIRQNLQTTGLCQQAHVLSTDAISYLSHTKQRFDIAFIDPPYQEQQLPQLLPVITNVMKPTGIMICEHPKTQEVPKRVGMFQKQRVYRYGTVVLTRYCSAETSHG